MSTLQHRAHTAAPAAYTGVKEASFST